MKAIKSDHFKNYSFIQNLKSSGDTVSFILKQADLEQNIYKSDIWIIKKGESPHRLTHSGDISSYWWLNNDEIVFSALRNKKDKKLSESGLPLSVLYKISTSKAGESSEWIRFDHNITDILFINENFFFFTAVTSPLYEKLKKNSKNEQDLINSITAQKDYDEIEELPFWNNGKGFSEKKRNRVYCYDKGKTTSLTGDIADINSLIISEDKKYIFYTSSSYKKVASLFDSVYRIDISNMQQKRLKLPEKLKISAICPIDNNTVIIAASYMKIGGLNENDGFYKFVISENTLIPLYEQCEFSIYDTVNSDLKMAGATQWSIRNNLMYWVSTIDYSSYLMTLNVNSGEISKQTKKDGSVNEVVITDNDIYYTALRGLDGVEIYCLQNGREIKLTEFNSSVDLGYDRFPLEKLVFENSLNVKITGWVIKPKNFSSKKKYPAILNIHGGPKTCYGSVIFHEMQYWASKGYGVFFCNPTGSDGRGQKFSDIRGAYGATDYNDLMRFTDEVLKKHSWIDKKRIGVTGGSYGGFMTNWIIGHTDRFKAAVSQRSISNWISMALTTDIGYYFAPDQTAADIWSNNEKMWEQSPLKYADKVKTPTLFIHSREDYRCWLVEALQMYSALQIHGVDTKLCLFNSENHELSRSGKPTHRVKRLEEITGWFDKYLK